MKKMQKKLIGSDENNAQNTKNKIIDEKNNTSNKNNKN